MKTKEFLPSDLFFEGFRIPICATAANALSKMNSLETICYFELQLGVENFSQFLLINSTIYEFPLIIIFATIKYLGIKK